jgi:wobble nucleotide-excising tRNase
LETETKEEVYENEIFLVTTKKRMIYRYFLKYKETDRRREQILSDILLHINEETVHKLIRCTKITELKTLSTFGLGLLNKGCQNNNSSRDEIHEKNSMIHLD